MPSPIAIFEQVSASGQLLTCEHNTARMEGPARSRRQRSYLVPIVIGLLTISSFGIPFGVLLVSGHDPTPAAGPLISRGWESVPGSDYGKLTAASSSVTYVCTHGSIGVVTIVNGKLVLDKVCTDSSGSASSACSSPCSIDFYADSNYEFSKWTTSGSISVACGTCASTTLTVSGSGTLTGVTTYHPVICPSFSGLALTISTPGGVTTWTFTWSVTGTSTSTEEFQYGIGSSLTNVTVTSPKVALTGLTAPAIYTYVITATGTNCNSSINGPFFTTPAGGGFCPEASLSISNPTATESAPSVGFGDILSWTGSPAPIPGESPENSVAWGLSPSSETNYIDTSGTSVAITGLPPSTTIYFTITDTGVCFNSATDTGNFQSPTPVTYSTTAGVSAPLCISNTVSGSGELLPGNLLPCVYAESSSEWTSGFVNFGDGAGGINGGAGSAYAVTYFNALTSQFTWSGSTGTHLVEGSAFVSAQAQDFDANVECSGYAASAQVDIFSEIGIEDVTNGDQQQVFSFQFWNPAVQSCSSSGDSGVSNPAWSSYGFTPETTATSSPSFVSGHSYIMWLEFGCSASSSVTGNTLTTAASATCDNGAPDGPTFFAESLTIY